GGHGAVAVKPQAAFTGGLKSLARLQVADRLGRADAADVRAVVRVQVVDVSGLDARHVERRIDRAPVELPVSRVFAIPRQVAVADAEALDLDGLRLAAPGEIGAGQHHGGS